MGEVQETGGGEGGGGGRGGRGETAGRQVDPLRGRELSSAHVIERWSVVEQGTTDVEY